VVGLRHFARAPRLQHWTSASQMLPYAMHSAGGISENGQPAFGGSCAAHTVAKGLTSVWTLLSGVCKGPEPNIPKPSAELSLGHVHPPHRYSS
jgi:hypothetical protein